MIVPFLFSVETPINGIPKYLWIFYKYINFAIENNTPMISQEEFYFDPEISGNAGEKNSDYDFFVPTLEQLNSKKKYQIKDSVRDKFLEKYQTEEEASYHFFKERNSFLEQVIEEKIQEIIEEYKDEKIEAILTWLWFPSLEYVAKKYHIPLIHQELSSIRPKTYNTMLGYFQTDGKYNSKIVKSQYNEFLKEIEKEQIVIWDRKTLLSFFLKTENLHYIKEMYQFPEYEFGIDLGASQDTLAQVYGKKMIKDQVNDLLHITPKKHFGTNASYNKN